MSARLDVEEISFAARYLMSKASGVKLVTAISQFFSDFLNIELASFDDFGAQFSNLVIPDVEQFSSGLSIYRSSLSQQGIFLFHNPGIARHTPQVARLKVVQATIDQATTILCFSFELLNLEGGKNDQVEAAQIVENIPFGSANLQDLAVGVLLNR